MIYTPCYTSSDEKGIKSAPEKAGQVWTDKLNG
jgi:hypothetical protein